jgi:hypothetical protein
MKKTLNLFGIIALVAVIGFALIGCNRNERSSGTSSVHTVTPAVETPASAVTPAIETPAPAPEPAPVPVVETPAPTPTTPNTGAGTATVSTGIVNNSGEAWAAPSQFGNSGYIFNSNGTFSKLGGTGGDHWEYMFDGKYSIKGSTLTLVYEWDDESESHNYSVSGNKLILDGMTFTISKTAAMDLK